MTGGSYADERQVIGRRLAIPTLDGTINCENGLESPSPILPEMNWKLSLSMF
jgi:hypothetical protein